MLELMNFQCGMAFSALHLAGYD